MSKKIALISTLSILFLASAGFVLAQVIPSPPGAPAAPGATDYGYQDSSFKCYSTQCSDCTACTSSCYDGTDCSPSGGGGGTGFGYQDSSFKCYSTQCTDCAACTTTCYDGTDCSPGGGGGTGGGGGGGGGTGGTINVPIPSITSVMDFYTSLKAIVQWVLVFGIILGVLFVMIGAIYVLTSRGDTKRLETGKMTLTWALAGVALLILSYGLVNLIGRFLGLGADIVSK